MAKKADTRAGDRHQGVAKTIRFSEADAALLAEAAKDYGGMRGAVMAGLHCLKGKREPTNDELMAILKARLK